MTNGLPHIPFGCAVQVQQNSSSELTLSHHFWTQTGDLYDRQASIGCCEDEKWDDCEMTSFGDGWQVTQKDTKAWKGERHQSNIIFLIYTSSVKI